MGKITRFVIWICSKFMRNEMPSAPLPWVKKRLFTGCPDGATASATFFSLIETAKANSLDPYGYLRYFFKKLPLVQAEQDLRELLPQISIPTTLLSLLKPNG